MKNVKRKIVLGLALLASIAPIYSQCETESRVLADGTMMYFFEPTNFYKTNSKSLKMNIVTDDEHFFIALQPLPFPERGAGKKIKEDLSIQLSNNNWYVLKHYDTQYLNNDTILKVLYLIDKKDLQDFRENEAVLASINMEGTEFVRNYDFKLHKRMIIEQLDCYFNSKTENSKSN